MSGFYTVLAAENKGTKPNPHGGTLVKWYVTLRNSTGDQLTDVYWQRKEGSDVNVGDTVYGSVKRGEYGPRFKMERKPDDVPHPASSAGPQASSSAGASPQPPDSPPKAADGAGTLSTDDNIRWQVCLKVAGEVYAGRTIEPHHVITFAQQLFNASPHSPLSTGHTSLPKDNGGAAVSGTDAAPPASTLEEEVDRQVASGGLVEEYDEGTF